MDVSKARAVFKLLQLDGQLLRGLREIKKRLCLDLGNITVFRKLGLLSILSKLIKEYASEYSKCKDAAEENNLIEDIGQMEPEHLEFEHLEILLKNQHGTKNHHPSQKEVLKNFSCKQSDNNIAEQVLLYCSSILCIITNDAKVKLECAVEGTVEAVIPLLHCSNGDVAHRGARALANLVQARGSCADAFLYLEGPALLVSLLTQHSNDDTLNALITSLRLVSCSDRTCHAVLDAGGVETACQIGLANPALHTATVRLVAHYCSVRHHLAIAQVLSGSKELVALLRVWQDHRLAYPDLHTATVRAVRLLIASASREDSASSALLPVRVRLIKALFGSKSATALVADIVDNAACVPESVVSSLCTLCDGSLEPCRSSSVGSRSGVALVWLQVVDAGGIAPLVTLLQQPPPADPPPDGEAAATARMQRKIFKAMQALENNYDIQLKVLKHCLASNLLPALAVHFDAAFTAYHSVKRPAPEDVGSCVHDLSMDAVPPQPIAAAKCYRDHRARLATRAAPSPSAFHGRPVSPPPVHPLAPLSLPLSPTDRSPLVYTPSSPSHSPIPSPPHSPVRSNNLHTSSRCASVRSPSLSPPHSPSYSPFHTISYSPPHSPSYSPIRAGSYSPIHPGSCSPTPNQSYYSSPPQSSSGSSSRSIASSVLLPDEEHIPPLCHDTSQSSTCPPKLSVKPSTLFLPRTKVNNLKRDRSRSSDCLNPLVKTKKVLLEELFSSDSEMAQDSDFDDQLGIDFDGKKKSPDIPEINHVGAEKFAKQIVEKCVDLLINEENNGCCTNELFGDGNRASAKSREVATSAGLLKRNVKNTQPQYQLRENHKMEISKLPILKEAQRASCSDNLDISLCNSVSLMNDKDDISIRGRDASVSNSSSCPDDDSSGVAADSASHDAASETIGVHVRQLGNIKFRVGSRNKQRSGTEADVCEAATVRAAGDREKQLGQSKADGPTSTSGTTKASTPAGSSPKSSKCRPSPSSSRCDAVKENTGYQLTSEERHGLDQLELVVRLIAQVCLIKEALAGVCREFLPRIVLYMQHAQQLHPAATRLLDTITRTPCSIQLLLDTLFPAYVGVQLCEATIHDVSSVPDTAGGNSLDVRGPLSPLNELPSMGDGAAGSLSASRSNRRRCQHCILLAGGGSSFLNNIRQFFSHVHQYGSVEARNRLRPNMPTHMRETCVLNLPHVTTCPALLHSLLVTSGGLQDLFAMVTEAGQHHSSTRYMYATAALHALAHTLQIAANVSLKKGCVLCLLKPAQETVESEKKPSIREVDLSPNPKMQEGSFSRRLSSARASVDAPALEESKDACCHPTECVWAERPDKDLKLLFTQETEEDSWSERFLRARRDNKDDEPMQNEETESVCSKSGLGVNVVQCGSGITDTNSGGCDSRTDACSAVSEEDAVWAHRSVLCESSGVWAAMLASGGEWREAASGEVRVGGVSLACLRAVVHHLYGCRCAALTGLSLQEAVQLLHTCHMYGLADLQQFAARQIVNCCTSGSDVLLVYSSSVGRVQEDIITAVLAQLIGCGAVHTWRRAGWLHTVASSPHGADLLHNLFTILYGALDKQSRVCTCDHSQSLYMAADAVYSKLI